jgi:3-oxoacyl-[acyl-carrier protein] reductase
LNSLKDKVAIITGASRGIGRGIALELARQGASILINYRRDEDAAREVVEHIQADGGQAAAFQADVSITDQAAALIQAAVRRFGQVDILVNNAGITDDQLIAWMKPESFDRLANINLRSAFLCSKAAIEQMMCRSYGRIINMTSVSGILGQVGQTNYSSTKAGLIGFTKALAREVAPDHITVNAIAPGFVLTALTHSLPKEYTDQLNRHLAIKEWATIEDVAHATTFLASDEARMITGQVLAVDGGMSM